eukprot:comp13053_c0_seq1/m.8331 comp13053_c0_seq1/g.8331  ORF comp13053_c0_seq1/g.8331 comp13053_c0_seq1/m.8331 type:complete len:285 (-) comp13053_c0_seq1:35-889(-)
MARRCLIAAAQMTSTADIHENFRTCERLARRAKEAGAQMLFFPEAFDFISEGKEQSLALAEPLTGSLFTKYRQLARDTAMWISYGGFHEKGSTEGHISNTHVLVNSEGEIAATYRKLHLYDVDVPGGVTLKESDTITPGSSITPPVETPVGKVGLSICYDLRFPELALSLAKSGADILTYPSAFSVPTGADHWEVLLRARAIECQAYVVAAAQVGTHNPKRQSYGHAMIIDPWGTIVAATPARGEGLCYAEVDLGHVTTVRTNMPVMQHRRPDCYGDLAPKTSA